jgi:hypothetical protein
MRDPFFIVTVYSEGPIVLFRCLSRARSAYPNAKIVVISDGFDHPKYQFICNMFGCSYVLDKRLKMWSNAAMWWDRFCEHGLRSGCDHVLKVDPDAWIHRRFDHFPMTDIAGWVEHQFVQGGIEYLSRDCLRKIKHSGECANDIYNNFPYLMDPQGRFSTDLSLWNMSKDLELSFEVWDEVHSVNRIYEGFEFRTGVAATHPHKL